jgi:beta-mannanase
MQIENGATDSYLKSRAKEMAAYGHPIIFAPLDEMNGNWNAYSGDPNAFKAAWVRVHGFFAGDLNVQFAFGVYNGSVPATPDNGLASDHPGGNFVDLVRVDGFYFGGQAWAQVFSAAL